MSYLKYIAYFIRAKKLEQRVYLKLSIANGISCSESLKMLVKAYGESILTETD